MSLLKLKKELPKHILNLDKHYKKALAEISERKRITKSYYDKMKRVQDIKAQLDLNINLADSHGIKYELEQ